jgi:hypothetical protein
MAIDLHSHQTRRWSGAHRRISAAPALTAPGSWTLLEGSTAELAVRRLAHLEPLQQMPLRGRIVNDGTGAFLISAAAREEDPAGPGLVFRSRRILADGQGRLTIPGSLATGDELLEVSFHGVLLPAEPGQDDGIIRAEARAELDRAGMRFLAGALETTVLHIGHGRLDARILAAAQR